LWFSDLADVAASLDKWQLFWLWQVEHMTQALREYFRMIAIHVINEGWGKLMNMSAQLAQNNSAVWQRRILLADQNNYLIYGRSAMTAQSVRQECEALAVTQNTWQWLAR